jgi:diguanylate cyclase
MCDIDHFKRFNDTYGHVVGDQALRLIAAAMSRAVRDQDTPARYGGEEFAVVLPNTSLDQAVAAAENLRRAIMEKKVVKRSTGEDLGRITVSIGVAQFQFTDSAQSFIERADGHLYAAKRTGRNRVVWETNGSSSDVITRGPWEGRSQDAP